MGVISLNRTACSSRGTRAQMMCAGLPLNLRRAPMTWSARPTQHDSTRAVGSAEVDMAVQGCKKADATGVILTFNGMRYAPLGTDLIAGCNGFYEAHKKAGDVKLYKPDGRPPPPLSTTTPLRGTFSCSPGTETTGALVFFPPGTVVGGRRGGSLASGL